MSFDVATLRDLCVICGDAVGAQDRGTANRLLAHEMAARLRDGVEDFNFLGDHPAFADDAITDFVQMLGVPTENRKGGIDAAAFYFHSASGLWNGSMPKDRGSGYAELFAGLNAEASAFINAIRTHEGGEGDAWVDAKRHRLHGAAAPSSAFASQETLSYSDVTETNTVTSLSIVSRKRLTSIVLGAGSWRVQVTARVLSKSTAPGASVGYALLADTFAFSTQTVARVISPTGDDVDIATDFVTSDDVNISSGTKTITVTNPTGDEELLDGVIRFWEL